MHEGTPIVFSLRRRRYDSPIQRGPQIGVFVSTFNHTIHSSRSGSRSEPKARVYSPISGRIHTPELERVKTLDNRPFNPDSIVTFHWEAVVRGLPRNILINPDKLTISRVDDPIYRCRATNILDIPPRQWPEQAAFKQTIMKWKANPCWIKHDNGHLVGYEGFVLNVNDYSASIMNQRQTDDWFKSGGWIYYDPESNEYPWQEPSRLALTKIMEKYEAAKKVQFKVVVKVG